MDSGLWKRIGFLMMVVNIYHCTGKSDNGFPYTAWESNAPKTGGGGAGYVGPAGPLTVTVNPAAGATLRTLATVDVTFLATVQDAHLAASYGFSGAGAGSLIVSSVNQTSTNTYRLVTSGTIGTGSFSLVISGIKNSSGALFSTATVSFTADSIAPAALLTPPVNSYIPSYNWGNVDFTYTEAVTGADVLANYTLSGTGLGSLAKTTVLSLGGNAYRLNFSGTPVTGLGQITITVSNVADSLGNTTSNAYTFYVDPPFASTVNPTSSADNPVAMDMDSNAIYIVGSDYLAGSVKQLRLEKWDRVTGTPMASFGTGGVVLRRVGPSYDDEYKAIRYDSGYIYTLGITDYISWGSTANLIIEKRDANSGALVTAFGTAGTITLSLSSGNDFPRDIIVQGNHLYIMGEGSSAGTRVEKRDKTTGNLVSGFGSGGILDVSSAYPKALAVDATYLYLAGGSGDATLQKRTLATGSLVSGFGSSGTFNDTLIDSFSRIVIDANNIYVIGYYFGTSWRVQRHDITTGTMTHGVGTTVTGAIANDIKLRNGDLFVVGYDRNGGIAGQGRVEKRSTSDLTLVGTYGTAGVTTYNPSVGLDSVVACQVDENYIYLFAIDSTPGNQQWRVDKSRNR